MKKLKIGLALGSGAARGLAHIGVLKTLEKHQIPIDVIAGTSMGAFIGGAYASGIKVEVMEEIVVNIDWKLTAKMLAPTISFSGFVEGKRINDFLRNVIGDRNIEDLDIRFACVATDILSGEEIMIEKGSLVEAIRASISIPVIFTPVSQEGRFLVDGGIVNPVPVDLARRIGADLVIAVNVIPMNPPLLRRQKMKEEKRLKSRRKEINSQRINIVLAKYLRNRINSLSGVSKISEILKKGEEEKLATPNFVNIFLNTINIFEGEIIKLRLEKNRPDFLIEPDTLSLNPREFYKAREAIKAGEEATIKIISDIKVQLMKSRRQNY